MLDTGLMLSAARSNQLPTQRVGTRKTASGLTFYDTLIRGVSQKGWRQLPIREIFKPQRTRRKQRIFSVFSLCSLYLCGAKTQIRNQFNLRPFAFICG